MKEPALFGWDMALISETYLSTLSALVKPHGLERYFVTLLHIASRSGEISQRDLGETLRRDKVTIMRMVDHLSDRGLVVRKKSPDDGRCHLLEVTEAGQELVPVIEKAIKKTDKILLEHLTKEEQVLFRKGLTKLMKKVNDLPESEFIVHASKRKKP